MKFSMFINRFPWLYFDITLSWCAEVQKSYLHCRFNWRLPFNTTTCLLWQILLCLRWTFLLCSSSLHLPSLSLWFWFAACALNLARGDLQCNWKNLFYSKEFFLFTFNFTASNYLLWLLAVFLDVWLSYLDHVFFAFIFSQDLAQYTLLISTNDGFKAE